MPEKIIDVEDLSKSFGPRMVFEHAALSVEEGTTFGLVGLNGSGKTTFIRLLLGLLKPDRGSVRVLGFEPWKHEAAYYRRLGVILDHDGFAGNLTVLENMKIFAAAKAVSWRQALDYVEEYWAGTFIHEEVFGVRGKVKYLSRGQKMQCALCRAFLSRSRAYFFDEPTVSLDVDACDHFYSLVRREREAGSTVLISSHQLAAIEELCDSVGMLRGKTVTLLASGADASAPKPWFLRVRPEENVGAIIEALCNVPAAYYGGAWHFSVLNPDAAVPRLVNALVSAGCDIAEVRPELHSLKDRMRTHSGNGEGA